MTPHARPSTSQAIRLDRVVKRYGTGLVLDNVTLEVRPGEFLTLLGPSGCGKTTTLRTIAGFVVPDAGRVWLDDDDVTEVPPNRRNIGMVYQQYALFPHMSVFENVAFGLRVRQRPPAEIRRRVGAVLELVRLQGLEGRLPRTLSGGQQQRVALARALVIEPSVLLLDEPLSNLDAKLRREMQLELRRLQRDLQITAVYVTHDQGEALAMSDRVAVMHQGRIEQIDTPDGLYRGPRTVFVAGFIGQVNLLVGRVARSCDETCEVEIATGWTVQTRIADAMPIGSKVLVAVRPENVILHEAPTPGSVEGRVTDAVFGGATLLYRVSVLAELGSLFVEHQNALTRKPLAAGRRVWVDIPAEAIILIPAPSAEP